MNMKIKTSKNYNIFMPYEVNRVVKEDTHHFKRLLASMAKEGWISAYPMHCIANGDGRFKIKAGHHRFRAAEILGIPVKYVVCSDSMPIQDLENAGPGRWNVADYLHSYSRQGVSDYVELLDYTRDTKISISLTGSMYFGDTAGNNNWAQGNKFKGGNFKIKDREHPRIVGDIVKFLARTGIMYSHEQCFVIALSKMCRIPEFQVNRFKKKASMFTSLFNKQRTVQDYLELFETVYNYKASVNAKLNIAFRANQVVAERNAVKKKKEMKEGAHQ